KLIPVPIEALGLAPDGRSFILNVERRVLERAPAFDREHWPDIADRRWGATTYAYYGYRPYWDTTRGMTPATLARDGERVRIRRSKHAIWAALAVILIMVAAGIGYLVYTRGWSSTRDTLATSAQAAFSTVEQTSRDAATTARVKTALALSKHVSAFDVKVESSNGRVALRGRVPSEEVREIAGVIARDTEGVTDVQNELTVEPGVKGQSSREGLAGRVADIEIRTVIRDGL